MTILYVFPHPDDESFGPAQVMSKQVCDGHEVHLLTLTRGGATKQRHKLGYSVDEMGEVRYREMQDVAKVLALTGLTVLDLPDSGLKEMDPREIEARVAAEIRRIRPAVVVTYAVHGISGFHDHLVAHAVVKRVFLEMKEAEGCPKRLALFTITEDHARRTTAFHLSHSTPDEIDCVVEVGDEDVAKNRAALDCYVSYKETIEKVGIKDMIKPTAEFELFQEAFDPPIGDLFESLPA